MKPNYKVINNGGGGGVECVDSLQNMITIRRYSTIHVGMRWKIQDRRQIKNTWQYTN